MAITAELLTDKRWAPKLRRVGSTGYTGDRTYKVNTIDEYEALNAAGLPQYRDPWSVDLPNCKVVEVGPAQIWGGTPDVNGENAWCRIPVKYETPGLGGRIAPPEPGDKWSSFVEGTSQVQVFAEVNAAPGANPINNGQGTPKDIANGVIRVFSYHELNAPPDFARMIQAKSKQLVNDAVLPVPGLFGTTFNLQFNQGEARYHDFTVENRDGVLEVVHTLKVAPDHLYYGQIFDDKGVVVQSEIAQIYEEGDLSGLW